LNLKLLLHRETTVFGFNFFENSIYLVCHLIHGGDAHKVAPVLEDMLTQADRKIEFLAAVVYLMMGPQEVNLCKQSINVSD